MKKLENKVAIITGGNAGVGKEIAKLFASEGATVVISARRQQALDEVAKEIEEAGGKVLGVPTDISKIDDVKNLIKTTIDTYGQLDILINNAGVLDQGLNAIDRIDYDDLNKVIDINQKGTMYCMSEALKVMTSGASIVNISSVAGQYGAGGAVYVSTKAAIIGVTKHTAMRFAKEKIRCNVICPGSITTSMAAGLTPDTMDMKMMGAMSAHSDLSLQPCSPLDVAKVALFLASDDAAPLTGQVIVSDYGVDL
ncbi:MULTISPECIES: SDR family NAD(P)-dependent oxidoreductase [Coprobacillaceae]|uniref:SDR family NAD(P)-dependent oxidoreductase n=1 Tax=Coprobacillaceae TaxID=2810280 RepID=UPI000E4AE003|nr:MULTISPECIES: SDR family oxidoreductase [Coprobacillaceae]RHM63138.1 SDR family NAD(P)-dependent oxidoreductase [Coprobacillus sp. AF33-1AC]RHS93213.1 SDR family NAD(P)-dependent oxidoreductase [Erysipelatoclostridium sp. AM42-17]